MILLDDNGLAIWRNKYAPTVFAERCYEWVDRLLIIREVYLYEDVGCPTMHRNVIGDLSFTEFNFQDWIPVTKEQFSKVKMYYSEINEYGTNAH